MNQHSWSARANTSTWKNRTGSSNTNQNIPDGHHTLYTSDHNLKNLLFSTIQLEQYSIYQYHSIQCYLKNVLNVNHISSNNNHIVYYMVNLITSNSTT